MITRMAAHQLREYVAGHMEPMRGTKVLDRRLEWRGIKEFPIHP